MGVSVKKKHNTNTVESLTRAISNKLRLDILSYIHQEIFLIKSDLIMHFDLQRAGLDFHLSLLKEAGLIGEIEIKIKGRKYVYIYPKSNWKIELYSVETTQLDKLLPQEVSEEQLYALTKDLWTSSTIIKDPQIKKKILNSLVSKMGGDLKEHICKRCENYTGIMLCSGCQKLYCTDCAEIINRPNDKKIILCYDCIANQFS